MISVLLLVFLLQLTIHLINTFGAQAVSELLWTLYTYLPTPQSASLASGSKLKADVVRLHREMKATSAQDDFAKWARIRRDHDRAKDKYDKQSTDLQSFRTNFDRATSLLRWAGTQGLQFLCNFWFSKQPMFWLPANMVPYPVEWLMSFPRAPVGGVSINVWAAACAGAIALVSEGVRAGWALREGKVVEGTNRGERIEMEPMLAGGGGKGKKEL
ncbi:hypothetical protein LTR08_003313 [Meristemomyces frigidus]|nr:hypothetical protein LTR08_003313 [Meristemomyces frigidus]